MLKYISKPVEGRGIHELRNSIMNLDLSGKMHLKLIVTSINRLSFFVHLFLSFLERKATYSPYDTLKWLREAHTFQVT